ncbi:hypothetical protein KRX54_03525 [Actinomycetaceae bacterium TAE3-ERU4]|nr:hypothetical protein [Actinomycetaceae bacterium TAE3-ERU4]
MPRKPIESKMPTWLAVILAVIMVTTMGGISAYLVHDLRNPKPIAKAGAVRPDEGISASGSQSVEGPKEDNPVLKMPQVAQIISQAALKPADFPAKDGVVYFRSPSANEVCAYSQDITKLANNPWVVVSPVAEGSSYRGPGVVCSQVRGALLPAREDRHPCPAGELRGRSATITNEVANFGACLQGGANPVQADARDEKNVRFKEFAPVANGSYLRLGNDFVCGAVAPDFACASLKSGTAFYLTATGYKLYTSDK